MNTLNASDLNSNSKTLILKDSSVWSIWTYVTASPCYTTINTNKHDYTTNSYNKTTTKQQAACLWIIVNLRKCPVWSPEGVGDTEFHGNWTHRVCPNLACRNCRHRHMLIAESANRISSPFQEFFSPFLITMKTNVTLKGPQQKRGSSFAFLHFMP